MLKFQSMLLFAICAVYCLSVVAAAPRGQCERNGGICVPKGVKRCRSLNYECNSALNTCCKRGQKSAGIRKKDKKKRKCKTKRKCSSVNGECIPVADTCDGTIDDDLCKGASCTCCITVLNCTCGEINTNRIVGGEEVEPQNKYPFMVGIIYPDFSRPVYFCGGSIINDLYVLSAAHCFGIDNPTDMQVAVGDHNQASTDDDISGVTQIIDIEDVIIHEKPNKNDIALVKLAEPLNLVDYPQIKPVCLPSDPSNDYSGETCTALGWGTEEYLEYDVPDILREVEMQIVDADECEGRVIVGIKVTKKMVCAAVDEGGKDTCQGDSGGPLIVTENGKQVLVGITSFGDGCGEPGFPGVYTRVTSYLKWIKQNTQDATYCT